MIETQSSKAARELALVKKFGRKRILDLAKSMNYQFEWKDQRFTRLKKPITINLNNHA